MGKRLLVLALLWGGAALSAQTIVQQFTALSQGVMVSPMELKEPTGKGNLVIAMSAVLTPGIRALSVTDDAPDGGNTYQKIPGASSSCANKFVDIWYCENCKGGVTELKFHFSDASKVSVNSFLEVSDMALSSALDGSGAHVSDGTATSAGLEAGASITTTATDFIIGRYFPSAPLPTGVKPEIWTYNPAYVYVLSAPPGTYQPTLTGAKAGADFCMSIAAFKAAAPATAEPGKN